jgi:hypothetical protein
VKKLLVYRFALAALLLVVAAPSAFSEVMIQSIDKRTCPGQTGDRFFLIFCARSGSVTGHCFVIWARINPDPQTWTECAFGFYPVYNYIRHGIVFPAPGVLRQEDLVEKGPLVTHQLIVEVDESDFYRTQQAIHDWSDQKYRLVTNNCIHFLKDVASLSGLVIPPPSWCATPRCYLHQLMKAN